MPDLEELAVLIDDALAALVLKATVGEQRQPYERSEAGRGVLLMRHVKLPGNGGSFTRP